MLHEVVSDLLPSVPIEDIMRHVVRLSGHDRYQASKGIQSAAAYVAEEATRVGLEEVSVTQFPADNATRWWSYRAPVPWTPSSARLRIEAAGRVLLNIDHATQPMALATYSAPTPSCGVYAPLIRLSGLFAHRRMKGAIVVVEQHLPITPTLVDKIAKGGAIGFIASSAERDGANRPHLVGRLELDSDASLFGFSVTQDDLATAATLAESCKHAYVNIAVERQPASMPVVSGILPGYLTDKEIWVTAHLCHPRPGANDNASGVSAALGMAAVQAACRRSKKTSLPGRTIRFVWGPEFVGVAAMLYQNSGTGKPTPTSVINLDMVGEDQALCGGPFIIERSPDFIPSFINPLAEAVVAEVFARTSSATGTWKSIPFLGFSDHALFADRAFRCEAVQFCHSPDRFNHSSEDSIDKVSRDEMVRSTAVGCLLAQYLTDDRVLPPAFIKNVIDNWCSNESATSARIAELYAGFDGGRWSREFLDYVGRRSQALSCLTHSAPITVPARDTDGSPRVVARWSGPFNTRAMITAISDASRIRISELVSADKGILSLLMHFAVRIDDQKTRREIIRETSFEMARPIPEERAHRLFDALLESGWAEEV